VAKQSNRNNPQGRFTSPDPKQVKFYFDKNIWSDIMDIAPSDLADFRRLIEPLKQVSRIGIWYSPVGVLELAKQIGLERHYEKCQREVKLAFEIADKNFLDNPWDHVRRIACRLLHMPFQEPDLSFLNLCREIAVLPYNLIEPKITRLRKTMTWEERWAEDLVQTISTMRKDFGLEPRDRTRMVETDEFRSVRGTLLRRKKYWKFFCRHFRLPPELDDMPFEESFPQFHSFRYWVDYRIGYENMVIYQNKKPRPSDYLDWEQLVYLNIMDYLVTNDEGLRSILVESVNPELNNVTLRFQEFVNCLKGQLPPRRAPDAAVKKWFDAKI
jgi:glycosyltransferase involved in cell wall biosynthesis